jgi:hypothetical protein
MTPVERRVFLAGTLGLLAAPLAAETQQKVHQIGVLGIESPAGSDARLEAFR